MKILRGMISLEVPTTTSELSPMSPSSRGEGGAFTDSLSAHFHSLMDQDPKDENDDLTSEERERRRRLEYEEGDEPAMEVTKEERIAQIELANFAIPQGGKVWHARLPNFLSLNSTPFEEIMWEPPEDIDEASQGAGGADSPAPSKATVPDENVIRWRWTKDELGAVVCLARADVRRKRFRKGS
jgi:RNA polymerase-associated protein LEO1